MVRASLVAAAVAVVLAAPAGAGQMPGGHPFSCPRDIVVRTDDPGVVAAAVRRLVPSEYRALTSMGKPAWPHAQVAGVVATGRRIYDPQAPLHVLAVRLCGERVAEASWTVFLQFPWCQIPCSEDVALVARTRRGWRIWYSEFRRP